MMHPSTRELPQPTGTPAPLAAQRFEHYARCVTERIAGRTIAFLDRCGTICWSCGADLGADERLGDRLRTLADLGRRTQWVDCVHLLLAVPIARDGEALGAIIVSCARAPDETLDQLAAAVARQVSPVAARLAHEWAAAGAPDPSRCDLEEPTVELKALFATGRIARSLTCEPVALGELLHEALCQVGAVFAAAFIPERAVDLTCSTCANEAPTLSLYRGIQLHLLRFMLARAETLLVNRPAVAQSIPSRKTLAVPIELPGRGAIGLLVFLRDPEQPDFAAREVLLAGAVARGLAAHSQQDYDPLKALFTGPAMRTAALNALAYRAAYERHVLMYLDIDGLGAVNEDYGYAAGDAVVTHLAALLRPALLPAEAIAARLTGDRFAVLLPGSRSTGAQRCAQQVCAALAGTQWRGTLGTRVITTSIGITRLALEPGCVSFDRALLAAELASRAAKQRGGNCIELYSPLSAAGFYREKDLVRVMRLRAALEAPRGRGASSPS